MVIKMIGNETKEVREAIEVLKANGAVVFDDSLEAFAYDEAKQRLKIAREGDSGILIPIDDKLNYAVFVELYDYLQNNEQAFNYDAMDDITMEVIKEFNS